MNAILSAVAQDKLNRYDTVRRKNAEQAYTTQTNMKDSKEALVKRLEALLLGTLTEEEALQTVKDQQKLQAGQVKRVSLPLGQTLEETIRTWGDARAEAESDFSSPTDIALHGQASSAIRQAESVIALHNLARNLAKQPWIAQHIPPEIPSYESVATRTYTTQQNLLSLPYAPNVSYVA